MSICSDEVSKVRSTELKHCSGQYLETKKEKSNIKKWNTADVNMLGQGKLIKTGYLITVDVNM